MNTISNNELVYTAHLADRPENYHYFGFAFPEYKTENPDDSTNVLLNSALVELLRFSLCEDNLTEDQYNALFNLVKTQYNHYQFSLYVYPICFWVSI